MLSISYEAFITLLVNSKRFLYILIVCTKFTAVIANIYFLTRKENRFARSLLITIIALVIGIGLGSAIAASLMRRAAARASV